MVLKLLPFLILLTTQAQSQQKIASKFKYSSINHVGLLAGGSGESTTVQTINGVTKGKYFAGVGTGIDFYKSRTIPVFLDLRRELSSKINTPFVYADAGVNFYWQNSLQKEQHEFRKFLPGLYYDLGVGWKLKAKNNRGFLISAGYSFKQVRERIKNLWSAPTVQLQEDSYDRYNYLYRRVIVKVAVQL